MRTCRHVWFAAIGVVCVLGLAGTAAGVAPVLILWTGFALAVFGALLALSFKEDLVGVRHPILWGAALATTPALVPGLSDVLGDATAPVLIVLTLTSPWVLAQAEKRVRPWLGPACIVRAGMAAPEEALRRQWAESTRQLGEATSSADRLMVVAVRQQILDDIAARHAGQLPPFVWDQPGTGAGLDHPTDEPGRPR